METKKVNFFKQIFYAVSKPKKYVELTKISTGRLVGFVFLLVLLTTASSFLIPLVVNEAMGKGFTEVIEDYMPEFELKNGVLDVDGKTEVKENGTVFVVDTTVDHYTSSDLDQYPSRFTSVTLISKTNLVTRDNGNVQDITFDTFKGLHLTKPILQSFVPVMYGFILFFSMLFYLFMVAWYFLNALMYSWVGMLIQKSVGIKLPFAYLYRIAIYSKVTILLVKTLLGLFGVPIPAKFLVSVAVTILYMTLAIIAHKDDPSLQMNPEMNYYNYNGNNSSNQNYYGQNDNQNNQQNQANDWYGNQNNSQNNNQNNDQNNGHYNDQNFWN